MHFMSRRHYPEVGVPSLNVTAALLGALSRTFHGPHLTSGIFFLWVDAMIHIAVDQCPPFHLKIHSSSAQTVGLRQRVCNVHAGVCHCFIIGCTSSMNCSMFINLSLGRLQCTDLYGSREVVWTFVY